MLAVKLSPAISLVASSKQPHERIVFHAHKINRGSEPMHFEELENRITADTKQNEVYKTITQYSQKRELLERLDVLAQRKDNWDGYESKSPTELTLDHARHLIEELFDSIASAGHLWLTPFISSDEDGYVTAEWHKEGRRLHLQIGENEAEYIQVWGTNIDTEMHVDFLNRDDYLTLWEWLLDE